jgi:hypothetical protein
VAEVWERQAEAIGQAHEKGVVGVVE